MTRMPSLTALRALHAFGSQGSVGRAAEVLNVTHGAISHQLRRLEDELGFDLIDRERPKVALTPAGQDLMRQISPAFEILGQLQFAPHLDGQRETLRIACAPALLACIVNMLDRFVQNSPEVEIHLLPIGSSAIEDADLVITFGESHIKGARIALLSNILYFPVCSPRLLNKNAKLRSPRDLSNATLLHEQSGDDWSRYFRAAGHPGLSSGRNVYLPDAAIAIQAAISGLGVAISDTILAGDALAKGHLIRLFNVEFPALNPYFLVTPSSRTQAATQRFLDWLQRELNPAPNSGPAADRPAFSSLMTPG